jgi:hypothetical protein
MCEKIAQNVAQTIFFQNYYIHNLYLGWKEHKNLGYFFNFPKNCLKYIHKQSPFLRIFAESGHPGSNRPKDSAASKTGLEL